jgi:predicted Zn-dependent protease
MGFTFAVPKGFTIMNNPSEIIATNAQNAILILDSGRDDQGRDPLTYINDNWMKGKGSTGAESITINGMRAATSAFAGTANGQSVIIRVVAIEWKPGQFFRFQMAIPQNSSTEVVDGLKRTTYSFRAMSESERASIHPLRVRTFTASAADSVPGASARMAFPTYKEERFRVLNALSGNLVAGQIYKIVTE